MNLINKVLFADCFNIFPYMEDKSVDFICTDPPYLTTSCDWECAFNKELFFTQCIRVLKDTGVLCIFGSQPFSSEMVVAGREFFKYEWVWIKGHATGHVHSKNRPMKKHEQILIFSKGVMNHVNLTKKRMIYFPQGLKECGKIVKSAGKDSDTCFGKRPSHTDFTYQEHSNYPTSDLYYKKDHGIKHQTAKPLELVKYLIQTYSLENELVFDPFLGSGTTAIASKMLNRRYIGIEKVREFYKYSIERLNLV